MMRRSIAWIFALCVVSTLTLLGPITMAQDHVCPSAPSQLTVGATARSNDPLNVRSAPGTANAKIGQITLDRVVQILAGPICDGSWRWWQVSGPNMEAGDQPITGWVVEVGSGSVYLLLPNDGRPIGAHNRWDPNAPAPTATFIPSAVVPVATPVPVANSDRTALVDFTGACHDQPYNGMRFFWFVPSHRSPGDPPNIGIRMYATVDDRLNSDGKPQTGVIDSFVWDLPFVSNREYSGVSQVIADPQQHGDRLLVHVQNSRWESGWIFWNENLCEWSYPATTWTTETRVRVASDHYQNLPFMENVQLSESGIRIPNGTELTLTGAQYLNQGYRWWHAQLANGQTGWVPEGLPTELWLAPTIAGSSLPRWSSSAEPQATRYLFVPSPLAPDSVLVFQTNTFHSPAIGVLQFGYYELLAGQGEWTQVRTADGQVGWVGPNLSLEVGTQQSSQQLNLYQILNDSQTTVNVYSPNMLPEKYLVASALLLGELDVHVGKSLGYGHFAYQTWVEGFGKIGLLCTSTDVLGTYLEEPIEQYLGIPIHIPEFIPLACVVTDVRDVSALAISGHPIGAYVLGSAIVLQNWRPFVRWNDRVWLMDLYQQSSSCLLTELIAGLEAQAACLGLPQ